jgi:hypothetical protein
MGTALCILFYFILFLGVQEVRWEGAGTKPAGEYTFFCGKGA